MTQRDRDRLVALKKAKRKLITQREAAEEIGQTERHVRRLLGETPEEGRSSSAARAARTGFEPRAGRKAQSQKRWRC